MRYSEDHKAQTHQRIIDEAALRFRRDGVAATGLQSLMKALGLTHGGFYAHFKSKGELVETALRSTAEQYQQTTAKIFSERHALQRFIKGYLSKTHRGNPGNGCPLTTLSAELGLRGEASPITDEVITDRLQMIESCLSAEDGAEQSVLILSAVVGGLLLARSVNDPALSDRLLETTRRVLLDQVSDQPEA